MDYKVNVLYMKMLMRYYGIRSGNSINLQQVIEFIDGKSDDVLLAKCHSDLNVIFENTKSLTKALEYTETSLLIKSSIGNLAEVELVKKENIDSILAQDQLSHEKEIEALVRLYNTERYLAYALNKKGLAYGRYITLDDLKFKINIPLANVSSFCNDIYKELIDMDQNELAVKNTLNQLHNLYRKIGTNPKTSVKLANDITMELEKMIKLAPISEKLLEQRLHQLDILHTVLDPHYSRISFTFI